jgi:hypothetical protein
MPVGFPGWTGGSPSRIGGLHVESIAVLSFESFGIVKKADGGRERGPRMYLFAHCRPTRCTPSAVVGRSLSTTRVRIGPMMPMREAGEDNSGACIARQDSYPSGLLLDREYTPV